MLFIFSLLHTVIDHDAHAFCIACLIWIPTGVQVIFLLLQSRHYYVISADMVKMKIEIIDNSSAHTPKNKKYGTFPKDLVRKNHYIVYFIINLYNYVTKLDGFYSH